MTLEEIIRLEDTVSARLGFPPTLVVEIGGLAAYHDDYADGCSLDWLSTPSPTSGFTCTSASVR